MGGPKDQHGNSGGYEPGADLRLDFIFEYAIRSLKIKMDKWQKMLNQEEFKGILNDFFDTADKLSIILFVNALGQLTVTENYFTVMKMKSCYFLKKRPGTFGKEDPSFRDHIIYGDLAPTPLDALMTYTEEVVGPIITSEVSQIKWPESVVADVKHHTEEICGALYTVQGQLRKKTLLHMPLEDSEIDQNERRVKDRGPPGINPEFKKQMESLVVKWNLQIAAVLQQDSSQALQAGQHPTPFAELNFWEERVDDLQCIYDQLSQEKVQKCGKLLENIESVYWSSFRATYRNVVSGLAESQDILAHLKPLRKYIETVQGANFDEVKTHLDPMLQCVCLIWGFSKHYCDPEIGRAHV